MRSSVRHISNLWGNRTIVGRFESDLGDHIKGVNITVVTILVLLFIIFAIQHQFTGSSQMTVYNSVHDPQYENDPNRNIVGNCHENMIGNGWKLHLTLHVSVTLSASNGFGCYELGLASHNSKAAVGSVGIGTLSRAFRGTLWGPVGLERIDRALRLLFFLYNLIETYYRYSIIFQVTVS